LKLLRSTIVRRLSRPTGLLIAALCLLALVHLGYAGDILRGGASAGARKSSSSTTATAGTDAANVATANAKDRLARTTTALNAVKNLQAAARAAAATDGIPDGLQPGGLKVLTGANAKWVGAALPIQSGELVTVNQTDAQAVLHWETFNIGKNTTLYFNQTQGKSDAGKWAAFNKVFDPSGKPSQIMGQIKAEGQVYVINQNGIIFGSGAQVNTRTFVASSLPINDNLISRGLLNQEKGNVEFLFSGLATGTFTPPTPLTTSGKIGDVVVQSGAVIESSVSDAGSGGRVMLVGPNVINRGTILTPSGQAILAAGLQVGVDAHTTDDPSLRGLDVYVGAITSASLGDYNAEAINSGLIQAARGNVTMTGRRITNSGVIDSSTTIDVNGRIDLLASYNATPNSAYDPTNTAIGAPFLYQSTGYVDLQDGSAIRVLPEWSNAKTIAASALSLNSQVNIQGRTIYFGKGSTLLAPSGDVTAKAGEWDYVPSLTAPTSTFVRSSGQVYLDANAVIDVSGSTNVFVGLDQSILTVQLRGSELANSPLQRVSSLRAVDLTVDIRKTGTYNGRDWIGTPLGDATGFANLIQRNVSQLTLKGGTVTLSAGDSVVMAKGSIVDASGGYTRNEGGMVKTTRVLRGNQIINIADATPDVIYDGIYDGMSTSGSAKWGVAKIYSTPLAPTGYHYQSEYIAGADAGTISITSPAMALDGSLSGRTVIGPNQLRPSEIASTLPGMGTLNLVFEGQDKASTNPLYATVSPNPPTIMFEESPVRPDSPSFSIDVGDLAVQIPEDRKAKVSISTSLFGQDGFGNVNIRNSDGEAIVPQGQVVRVQAGGSLHVTGSNVDVLGSIIAPGGDVTLTAYTFSPYEAEFLKAVVGSLLPEANPKRGNIHLASGQVISTAGLVIDDRPTSLLNETLPVVVKGGSVSLEAYSIALESGSSVDVSGGAVFSMTGDKKYGDGGKISLLAGQDPYMKGIIGGTLKMDGVLSGYSVGRGGALAIRTAAIQVGGTSAPEGVMLVTPEFFNRGGFSGFELTGIGRLDSKTGETIPGMRLVSGTVISPEVQSWSAIAYDPANRGSIGFSIFEKPEGLRPSISLSFSSIGATNDIDALPVVRGDLVFEDGASILGGYGGAVTLAGQTSEIAGSITAPGGTIKISGANAYPLLLPSPVALATVHIAPTARLSAAGATVLIPDPWGRLRGEVLDGGTISISGNIIADAGAVLDVSGASGYLDLTPAELGTGLSNVASPASGLNRPLYTLETTRTLVASSGGTIKLTGSRMLAVESTLLGNAGGPTALGGTLEVSSGRYIPQGSPSNTAEINLVVNPTGSILGNSAHRVGDALVLADGSTSVGMGYFSMDRYTQGGFSSLTLGGNVRFQGNVDVSADYALTVGTGGVIEATGTVNLNAPYIHIGQPFQTPHLDTEETFLFTKNDGAGNVGEYNPAPVGGSGTLNISGSTLVDVGSLLLNGISRATIAADNADIRGNGTFAMAGNLVLRAGQIYPTTASKFDIYVYNNGAAAGSVRVEASGTRPLPLSAGGSLSIMASDIYIGGTLRAPLGTISIGWDGLTDQPKNQLVDGTLASPVTNSLILASGANVSVSAVDPSTGEGILIPYGISPDGLSWISPSGLDITLSGLPEKRVSLGAVNLQTNQGSVIDLRGGGDIYAYQWVEGNGGSEDILAQDGVYAIVPGYSFAYAPYGAYSPTSSQLGGDPGYVNDSISIGDSITLPGTSAIGAGTYTLLPARYALLPGAVLVSVKGGSTTRANITYEEGSTLVAGVVTHGLAKGKGTNPVYTNFEIASSDVFRQRAEYIDYLGSDFLSAAALENETAAQRLPIDSGRLDLLARTGLVFDGSVLAKAPLGGRGSLIDIAAEGNIWITDGSAATPGASVVLNSAKLSSFGAESLLIGGLRSDTTGGTSVKVRSNSITVSNAGSPLSVPEVILVGKGSITLADDSSIISSGGMTSPAGNLLLSGDGALVRVSGDGTASMLRSSATLAGGSLIVGNGVLLSGGSVTLDATTDTDLSPAATIRADVVNLHSGRVSFLLNNPGSTIPTFGLVLSGSALQSLGSADTLSFLSYSSTDFYGTGALPINSSGTFSLRSGEIRGFNQNGGSVTISADDIFLDNSQGASGSLSAADPLDGSLILSADTLRIGTNKVTVNRFANVVVNASGGIFGEGTGELYSRGNITANTPSIAAAAGAEQKITALGDLVINDSCTTSRVGSGLGASLTISGRSTSVFSDISLPSGILAITATNGDLTLGGTVDLRGTSQTIYDLERFTDGGVLTLTSTGGNVVLNSGSSVMVDADDAGGNAGTVKVIVADGALLANGALSGRGSSTGTSGSFVLDTKSLANFGQLNTILETGAFNESRSFRVRAGDVLVDASVKAHHFSLSTDLGSITVASTIDASGVNGGEINLSAHGSVSLLAGSLLTVHAREYSNAGKGGAVLIEAGSQNNGVIRSDAFVDLRSGATIDLGVDNYVAGDMNVVGSSAFYGFFNGTLHLRAPQNASATDLQVNAIQSTITGASNILVEGYKLYDLTSTGGVITGTRSSATALPSAGSVQRAVYDNGVAFVGAAGTASASYGTMLSRLLGSDAQGLSSIMVIAPGAEIINRNGNLTLGSDSTTHTSDWSLADYRFGTRKAAGVLTLRATGDITFYNALSDGFTPVSTTAATGNSYLWLAPLMSVDPLRPANLQSYTFRITSGADMASAIFSGINRSSSGSIYVGRFAPDGGLNLPSSTGSTATTASAMAANRTFQVIRTGTGDIILNSAGDVQLRNQFATIYTAGVGTANRTKVFETNDFVTPILNKSPNTGTLGSDQQTYDAYYALAGGNVSIFAGNDIRHVTKNTLGQIIDDSSKQAPVNWLLRRGYVDPATGLFGVGGTGALNNTGAQNVLDASASTTWWINYSNFFEGVGALGGGDVEMIAGRDIMNVDAVVPTNARMAGQSNGVNIAPSASNLLEWGGGDITLIAGRDINGGAYYVERGVGTLSAGRDITTNSTRSASLGTLNAGTAETYDSESWIPTTLFVGKGGFNITARNDILLGPAVNPFLLPQGMTNKFYYKTYFSTLSEDSFVNALSLGGDITHRFSVNLDNEALPTNVLSAWFSKWLVGPQANTTVGYFYPWLRVIESDVSPFSTVFGLNAASLTSTALSGDITIAGDLTLAPSSQGTLELAAAGAVNGFTSIGTSDRLVSGSVVRVWTSSTINVSDTSPDGIPGVTDPFAYHELVGRSAGLARATSSTFLDFLNAKFAESGSFTGSYGVVQTKRQLHATGLLHSADAEPLRIYSASGNMSGFTLFSPKKAQILAGKDLEDVALYIQNLSTQDISIVAAGRDITLYNANTANRVRANSSGNSVSANESILAGDLQISGPGLLEVIAGRDIDLGTGANNSDGTGVGITSIGNSRNPYLPFNGASILAAAGIASKLGLAVSSISFSDFEENQKTSGALIGATSEEAMAYATIQQMFDILRAVGRAYPTVGNYDEGFAALASLFSAGSGKGNIDTRSRDIRTRNGGDITILAPYGKLTMATNILGNPLAPPGIVTESGGALSILTDGDVDIGKARIFSLSGGDIVIWSSNGNIAAGTAAKTVTTAPPTRVLIDPQTGVVETDLAGLATGGGIGTLKRNASDPDANVDLIAPNGFVDAGDAGIRSTGNLTIAAVQVLNADNISVQGTSSGVPAAAPAAAPNIGGLASAAAATAGANSAGQEAATQSRQQAAQDETPSIITVDVLGYGGGEDSAVPDTSASAAPAAASSMDSAARDDEENRRRGL